MARRICRSRATWMGVVLGAVALKLLLRRRTVWYVARDEPECRPAGVYPFEADGEAISPIYTGHFVVMS